MKFRIIDQAHGGYSRHPDPNDEWDRGEEYTNHNIVGAVLVDDETERRPWYDFDTDIDVKVGDDVWLVYVVYSTGSSFGKVDGCIRYIDLFTDADEAFQLSRDIKADYEKDFNAWKNNKQSHKEETEIAYTHNGQKKTTWCYVWKGYFDRLQSVEVTKIPVYPHDYIVPSRW